MMVSAPFARAQYDQEYESVSGGSVDILGNLYTDGVGFTPDGYDEGFLELPDFDNYPVNGGDAGFGNVTITYDVSLDGDVNAGNLSMSAANLFGMSFDGIDESSGNVNISANAYCTDYNVAVMTIGSHGELALTSNTGNSITFDLADFSIILSKSGGFQTIFLTDTGGIVENAGTTYMNLDPDGAEGPDVWMNGATLSGYGSEFELSTANATFALVGSYDIIFQDGFALMSSVYSDYADYGATVFGRRNLGIGSSANPSGNGAVAIGNSTTASGNLAVALGDASSATGANAIALAGGNATASNSTAIGNAATATANYSIAIGPGTVAQNWAAVVVGHYNQAISGNTTAWTEGDPAFIVGIGANATNRANGLVVLNNGNVTFNGTVSANATETLQVNGTATFNGQANFSGNVTLTTAQGDISMGNYTYSE